MIIADVGKDDRLVERANSYGRSTTARSVPAKIAGRDITGHYHQGTEPLLLVTFNSLSWAAGGAMFWGEHVVQKCGYSALGIMASGPNWFPAPAMSPIISGFEPIISSSETTVAYGHSMGGYGALKYAKTFKASCVIAFGPQYSIDPDDLEGRDFRYRAHYRAAQHDQMRITENDAVPDSYVFYDPFYPQDAYSARRIAAVTGCVLIPVFFTGHDCIQPFAGTTVVKELIGKCLGRDIPGLRAMANRQRRSHWARKHHLACRLLPRHSKWALGIYEKHWAEIPKDRYVDFASELSTHGFIDEAVDWSTRGLDEPAPSRGRLNAHIVLLLKAKRFEEASKIAFAALELDPGSSIFARRLSEIYLGMNDLDQAIRWAITSVENRMEDASGHNHLAGLLMSAGRLSEAEEACKKALTIEPDNQAFATRLRGIVSQIARSPHAGR